jgi:hypothetical protein
VALTAADAYTVAGQEVFQSRVKFFMQKASIAVMSEAGTTAGHGQRVNLASKILGGLSNPFEYALAVLSNSTLFAEGTVANGTNGISDSDLEFAINSMFSAFAGFDPN